MAELGGLLHSIRHALPSVGAIRAGLINVLVTDEECAREMLAIVQREAADEEEELQGSFVQREAGPEEDEEMPA